MKIGVSTIDGILVITLGEPEIVASNVERIKLELESQVAANSHRVVLDLGPVQFLDSSGVGLLVSIMKRVGRAGGQMRLAGLGTQPLALFRTVNLDRVMPLSRDIEEALTALRGMRDGASRAMQREEEVQAADLGGKIDQVIAHTRLTCEALFGSVPERLLQDLKHLFEREFLKRTSAEDTTPLALDDQLLAQKRQILGEMAQGMSGRFRNVLALVIGRVQFLRMVTTDEKVCGSLDIMENAALQGMAAVRRVEDFCASAAMRRLEQLPLRRVLDDALEMVRMKREDDLTRAGKHLRIIREFVVSPTVTGCEVELKHAFVDILLNALEAMPEGGVLTVSVNQSGEVVTVTIADTGRGMNGAAVDRAFDPLYSTKAVVGAGLGLPIARAVVEKHEGTITLESQESRGTTVTVRLPAAGEKAAADMRSQEAPPSPPALGGRVLVVDDEPMVCDLLKDILGAMGCDVVACQSGQEGVERFGDGGFDLVMTDLAMPGLTGWDVARSIRSRDLAVPVALFSAWGAQMDAAVMREKGVDFLFPKPFEISMIRNVLMASLELGRDRRSRLSAGASPAIG